MSDAYSENVVAEVRFGSSGPVTTIGDKTGLFEWTGAGNAAQVVEGGSLTGSYLSLDGTGDYISTPGRPSFRLGTGPFVIDFGIKTTSAGDVILDYTGSTTGYRVDMAFPAGTLRFLSGRSTIVKVGTIAIADGARHHVAIVRSADNTLRIFVDGVLGGSGSDTNNYSADISTMAIGAQVSDRDGTNDLTGKIDFLRITVGTDRGWTSAFTPPTLADIGFKYSAESTAALSASDSAQPAARWNVSTLDQVIAGGGVRAAYHYTITESVALASSAGGARLAQAAMTGDLALQELFASKGYLSGAVTQGFDVGGTASGKTMASAAISEAFQLDLAEVLPGVLDEVISTWCANLATSAHSRYAQYGFNSFARFGGRLYGCKSDGLYELGGDNDGANPIPWTATLGETDFGMDAIKRLPYVYVAAKTSGDLVLKVIEGPGAVHFFTVEMSSRESRSGRAALARGLSRRYWQIEIASDTERVELDALEFFPVKVSRRI